MSRTGEIGTEVGRRVAEAYPDGTAPGAAVLLARDGRVLYRGEAGLANLAHQVPLTPDMPFRLASLPKPLTATAVLVLVKSGRLALDDPLDRLLPGVSRGRPARHPEHLLTHTSGIHEFTELPEWWAVYHEDVTLDQVIDLFMTLPLAFAPGTRWAYSNSGYLLLGAIIETVSGQSFADFLADRIFASPGMSSTSYDATSSRVVPRMVSGHAREAMTTSIPSTSATPISTPPAG